MHTNFWYSYAVLLIGSLLGYRGVHPMAVLFIAMLLCLPVVAKERGTQVISLTGALSVAHGLVFAALAYAIGRGIALLIGT